MPPRKKRTALPKRVAKLPVIGGDDWEIPPPPGMVTDADMTLDAAIELACAKLGLPVLGGPSGRGWSFHSTAMGCPRRFAAERAANAASGERAWPSDALQIGGFYHALQGLYYAHGLGECVLINRGLVSLEVAKRAVGIHEHRGSRVGTIAPDAADILLKEVRDTATPLEVQLAASITGEKPGPKPRWEMVETAARCFDAHTNYYGNGNEDLTPLAIEWFARHEALDYTCRYDLIARTGPQDIRLPPDSIIIGERKTSAWLTDRVRTGWFLDGEVLGQIMCWKPSGCEALFGPLAGVLVDIVTKDKKEPKLEQVLVTPQTVRNAVAAFERSISYVQGQMQMWAASGYYPQNLNHCWSFNERCHQFQRCIDG